MSNRAVNSDYLQIYAKIWRTVSVCLTNNDCNSPFGWCNPDVNNGLGECTCTFGFYGTHCYNRK